MLFLSSSSLDETCFNQNNIDGIELRIDLFEKVNFEELSRYIVLSPYPVLITLRTISHGGKYMASFEKRKELILKLLKLKPAFFDLEINLTKEFISEVLSSFPDTKFILSCHHFDSTPLNIDDLYQSLLTFPVFAYKIAVLASSATEALKLILFAQDKKNCSVIPMGSVGSFARILAPIFNNLLHFTCQHDQKTGPGQHSITELSDIYRFQEISNKTEIFALIGDPVEQSIGHRYHNQVFAKKNQDAVYVKIPLKTEELSEFFTLARRLPFKGLSVTMPLKEKVLPFLDEIDPKAQSIGAINTILFSQNHLIGTNTDGMGALDVIEKQLLVKGKKIVILGTGGVSKAIAHEADRRGAALFIAGRTIEKTKDLAKMYQASFGMLHEIPKSYDLMINCTPSSMPIDPSVFVSTALIMDTVYQPKETLFLQAAREKGCQIIYGEEMFKEQAKLQTAFWSAPLCV